MEKSLTLFPHRKHIYERERILSKISGKICENSMENERKIYLNCGILTMPCIGMNTMSKKSF